MVSGSSRVSASVDRQDRRCIETFAAFLKLSGHPVCGVTRWPEDTKQGDIDAIIGPYAVQHTSVDTLPDGRMRDVWFTKAIAGIEDDFRGKLPFRLHIAISWDAVDKGQDWKSINAALRTWIVEEAPRLLEGSHTVWLDSTIVPFRIDVVRLKGAEGGVFFVRYAPGDTTLPTRLRDQLVGRHKKLAALVPHREEGKTAVLLLESHDLPLMNNIEMVKAFEAAFPTWPQELDELWLVHRIGPPEINIHDLRRGRSWIYDVVKNELAAYFDDKCCVQSDGTTR